MPLPQTKPESQRALGMFSCYDRWIPDSFQKFAPLFNLMFLLSFPPFLSSLSMLMNALNFALGMLLVEILCKSNASFLIRMVCVCTIERKV